MSPNPRPVRGSENSSDDGSSVISEMAWQETRRLRAENEALKKELSKLQELQQQDRASRRAALNLMEDALLARHESESVSSSLRENEKHFSTLFEAADEAYVIFEPLRDAAGRAVDFRFLSCNPAFTRHTGLATATGKTLLDVMPGLSAHCLERYKTTLESGKAIRFQEFVEPLGRWLEIFATRLGETDKARLALIFQDITERKAGDAAIRASEERFRMALESADMASWDYNILEGKIVWNAQHYHLLGLDPDGASKTEEDFFRAIHPADVDNVREQLRVAMEGSGLFRTDFRIIRRNDGSVRWMSGFGKAMAWQEGRISRMTGVMMDATERRESAEKLAAAQELWRIVVESAEEHGIITADLNRRVLTWNIGAEKIIGYTAEEMMGQSVDVIFTPEDLAIRRPETEVHLMLESGSAADNRWHLRRDGSRFFASGVMMPLRRRPGGEVLGFVKILRDETEAYEDKLALERNRIRLLEALAETQRAREELEAASNAKDQFLAILSHELRTPLTPVLMAARTLARRKDLPETVRDALEMIRRNVQIEARFIDDLLDVTRIARGKMELMIAPLDFHEAVQSAVDISQPDVEAKRQKITLSLEARSSRLEGDSERLQQVVWNLIKNASKFTPEEGAISLRTRDGDKELVLEILDTGIGIAPEVMPFIFDAFAQANREITREFGGLGLGLAISKATVEAHGGKLAVQSDGVGHGAKFTVVLPLSPPKWATRVNA